MKEKKITNKSLADEIGVSRMTISKLTNGINLPSAEKLISLANYFNVSIDFLLGRSFLLNKPDGILEYCFKASNSKRIELYNGKIKYSFGVISVNEFFRQFLFIDEIEGTFIDKIIDSNGQYEFLSLAYLINQKLDLHYDALENNNIDIVIKYRGKYQELCMELAMSPRFGQINYEDYLDQWLKLPTDKKVKKIEAILTGKELDK